MTFSHDAYKLCDHTRASGIETACTDLEGKPEVRSRVRQHTTGPQRLSAYRASAQPTTHQQRLTRVRCLDGWSDPCSLHGLAPTRLRTPPRLPHNSECAWSFAPRYVNSPNAASSWS